MCECATWARIPRDNFPPANHHYDCKEYKAERFVRVIYDGNNCIMEPDDAADMIADGDGGYQTEDVFMSRDQFDKLPEFDGF